MSVVYHRSTGKMILKNIVAAIILSFAWIKSVTGSTSYSNVFLQSGPGVALYDPMGLRSAQLAPLSAAPLMSNLLPPCVSPCVIPSQQVAALTPVASSSANFVTYKSPIRVPVVVAPSNDDNTSYEYSYVVYDEDTGDQKAQKETSDGSVVRGQYSLIQPDGYVRQVQYTADDLKGFNAVVNNFLPEEEAKAVSPCPEVKNEPLKETKEKTDESHDLEPEAQREAHKGESPEDSKKDKQSSKTQPEPEKQKDQELEIHQERGGQELHKINEEPAGPTVHEDHGELQGQEVQATEIHPSPEKHSEPENQGAHSTEGHGNEEKIEQEPRAIQVAEVLPTYVDALVSYNDVIKCIQSAISRANTAQPSTSPLTYIILNKPC